MAQGLQLQTMVITPKVLYFTYWLLLPVNADIQQLPTLPCPASCLRSARYWISACLIFLHMQIDSVVTVICFRGNTVIVYLNHACDCIKHHACPNTCKHSLGSFRIIFYLLKGSNCSNRLQLLKH